MDKTAIVYWSGTGNTEAMANAIKKGLEEKGASVDIMEADSTNAEAVLGYGKIAFGCPSMGSEVLEEETFEPLFTAVEKGLTGKKVALFGSYGWGDGEWMRNWVERTQNGGANLFGEGFIQNDAPDEAACEAYGQSFAEF